MKNWAEDHASDALVIVGACAVSWGVWLMHEPAGIIVAGLFLLAGGALLARKVPG